MERHCAFCVAPNLHWFTWLVISCHITTLLYVHNNHYCYVAGVFPATARLFIGSFMVTWHLTMKLFPAKCHEQATLRKLWRQTGNSSLLTAVARNGWNLSAVFKFCFCFVLLYNKSLNDWSLGEQWILFPSNLNVSRDEVEGNIEILGKQNSLFLSGPVIKCLLF